MRELRAQPLTVREAKDFTPEPVGLEVTDLLSFGPLGVLETGCGQKGDGSDWIYLQLDGQIARLPTGFVLAYEFEHLSAHGGR